MITSKKLKDFLWGVLGVILFLTALFYFVMGITEPNKCKYISSDEPSHGGFIEICGDV